MLFLVNLLFVLARVNECRRVTLQGNFTYCDVWNERRVVNLEFNCSNSLFHFNNESRVDRNMHTVVLMKRLHYVLDAYGIECYRKRVVHWLNSSFLGFKSESSYEIPIPMTRFECLTMIESKRCDEEPMDCDEDGCIYNTRPDGEFSWFRNSKFSRLNCKFHRRKVRAETNTSKVFANIRPDHQCTPPFLQCHLAHSIVIWNASDVSRFMYKLVHIGTKYIWTSHQTLYSNKSRMLFQLTNQVVRENNFTFHKTTVGLFLLAISDSLSNSSLILSRLSNFLALPNKKILSLSDLILEEMAETDFTEFSMAESFRLALSSDQVQTCSNFQNHLRLLASSSPTRSFHRISNMHGQEVIVFAQFKQLFIPRCLNVKKIVVDETTSDTCFFDLPVRVNISSREQSLFLSEQNFLVDWSDRLQCSSVNTRIWLNSTHIILRHGSSISLISPADLQFVDLSEQHIDFKFLNFEHNHEIVEGFDKIYKFHDHPLNNGFENHFRVLPIDSALLEKHSILSEWKNSVKSEINSIWSGFFISIKYIFFTIGIILTLLILAFLVFCFLRIAKLNRVSGRTEVPENFILETVQ